MPSNPIPASPAPLTATKPRVGFLGVGWIGSKRMEAIAESGFAGIAAITSGNDRSRPSSPTL